MGFKVVKVISRSFQTMYLAGIWDKVGVGLSIACIAHCVAMPLLVLAVPAIGASWFSDESVHKWLCLFVVISSILAFAPGYALHASKKPALIAVAGITLILSAVFMGPMVGEFFEKIQTFLGALTLIVAHILNHSFCRSCTKCKARNEDRE